MEAIKAINIMNNKCLVKKFFADILLIITINIIEDIAIRNLAHPLKNTLLIELKLISRKLNLMGIQKALVFIPY